MPSFHNCHTGSVSALALVFEKGTKKGPKKFATWRPFDMGEGGGQRHLGLGDLSGQMDLGTPVWYPQSYLNIQNAYKKNQHENKKIIMGFELRTS